MKRTRGTRKKPIAQLDFWAPAAAPATGIPVQTGRTDLQPTTVLMRHTSCRRVLEMIRQVRTFFPELDGCTIKVGLTRSAAGLASREDLWIWLNPRRLTYHTIAHECVHLLQTRGVMPSGEKSADLYALARDLFLVDDLPYYLTLPRSLRAARAGQPAEVHRLLNQVAREALQRREDGLRTYLKWFEEEVELRWESRRRAAAPITFAAPMQAVLF